MTEHNCRENALRERDIETPNVEAIHCAYCGGTGHDQSGVVPPLSACQVCGGGGLNVLCVPVAPCAFCDGTGFYPHNRLTCTSCGGKGMVEVPDDARTCPCCLGTGRAGDDPNYLRPESNLPCTRCGGKGIVAGGNHR